MNRNFPSMDEELDQIRMRPMATESLTPYARNSRTHSEKQIKQIAASIKEFGFTNPILIDSDSGIIAGHGRVMAAQSMGIEEVPCIMLSHLTDRQKRAYVIADNKISDNAGWDADMLALELADLTEEEFDMSPVGFEENELKTILEDLDDEDPYTTKIEAPIYQIKGEKPGIEELVDTTKEDELLAKIGKAKSLTKEERNLLVMAAARHRVFNYEKIAEFYAHAKKPLQARMEESALVIIDFDKAIAGGFVELSTTLSDIADTDTGNQ